MARFLKTLLKRMPNALIIIRSQSQLNQAVQEAEKIIGYSTSFLNLRWLLSDEIASVALNICKRLGSNHPLLQSASKLFLGNSNQNWGLIVLLVSKAAGLNNINNDLEKDDTSGILNSQWVLAEVTEFIRTSHVLHKSVINIDRDYAADLKFGNRLALLCGDFLLGKCNNKLAHIYNNEVLYVMYSSLRDLVESEFIDSKPYKPLSTKHVNIQNILATDPLDNKTVLGNPRAEWVYRSILGGASLLAKSCQCTLKLANHPDHIQKLGYLIGINIALAWQIQLERETFITNSTESIFSLVSAPVMLHLETDGSLYDLIELDQVDFNELRKRIYLGDSLNATKMLQKEFSSNALTSLSELPYSSARTALEKIIRTLL